MSVDSKLRRRTQLSGIVAGTVGAVCYENEMLIVDRALNKKISRQRQRFDECRPAAKLRSPDGSHRLTLIRSPFRHDLRLVAILNDRNRILGFQGTYQLIRYFSRLFQAFHPTQLTAGVHYDQNVRRHPPDTAWLMQDIVLSYYQVLFCHIRNKLPIFIKSEHVEFYFFRCDFDRGF